MLWRFRTQDVNMASTFECSRNDVIFKVAMLAAAGLVAATSSPWPYIVIGLAMVAVVLRSAVQRPARERAAQAALRDASDVKGITPVTDLVLSG